jgi:tRNA-splicing ligase RtcB (3'-phosphate/5'-hydroxy nucleic acid ligase)
MDTTHQMLQVTGPSVARLDVGHENRDITVIGNESIRQTFCNQTIRQAVNSRLAPGVSKVVLNPDAHVGYGAPVGCVMVSPTHVYPGPVGVDIKCSMSLLQLDLPGEAIADRRIRRELIKAIVSRTPTGAGNDQGSVKKSRAVDESLGFRVATEGASGGVLKKLGIPKAWAERCEDASHTGIDGSVDSLMARLEFLGRDRDSRDRLFRKYRQLGSYGGGNHFGEAEVVQVGESDEARTTAASFGLKDGHVAFLSHCGSRGLGHDLAMGQFRAMQSSFKKTGQDFPGGDPELVHAEVNSHEGQQYLIDMAMGANFATVNHLLINSLVLEAFQEVIPGVRGDLVYFISHNIVRQEPMDGQIQWVHRKGATRALPAGHVQLVGTPFESVGHPILLPGNPRDGSSVMVALPGAEKAAYSVNHGAGRALSRTKAKKMLNQSAIDQSMETHDIMTNCRTYPKDEAPDAYKDFGQVMQSVKEAGLAREVARLKARFVIKDGAPADD